MTRAWTPRVAGQLTVLAAAAFVYVTAEVLPIGALPAIAADLRVSEALVGTLLAGYALVAAVTTMPLVRLTASWPRRRTLLLTLVCLTASQAVCALAPNFAVLAGGRVMCALTHGLMWSVIAPIGVRLVPADHAARATTAVYAGTGLALVVGNPLTAAMSQLWGWRTAVVVVTAAAATVTVAAWRALPPMRSPANVATRVAPRPRNPRLVTLAALTLLGVTGHFMAYTFVVVVIRDVVGVPGAQSAWLLAAFGVAGLVGMAALARPGDRRPHLAVVGCLAVMVVSFGVLTGLAAGHRTGLLVLGVGALAVVAWGAASTAVPPMLQAAVMRTAPEDPDGASGVYVAAFQIGIVAGALGGGLLYERAGAGLVLAGSTAVTAVVLACVLRRSDLLRAPATVSER
ncbi:MFS transporter [Mycolicibacterium monacense]|uniref:MFS transporter n=1 Tax=Mycolicibacterium monacense TaxID=85693 RepID=UPI0007EB0571|nr:MFS transporter [Mycolicibacterium monacense]MDA4104439.1 membrane protein [Mycolicibacterium monacense DSM 44395]OBB61615.1 MFS transporter [Mycolicibacterium monacense]OBF58476.1 MFS transporter [Mycolicibacterium monacense]ORB24501.1 MFS transporter [Mycolicibacterium monacense DSM 44395]QHP84022.1 MFS transporter [Mycolicibacterium monacense DSM 44395]